MTVVVFTYTREGKETVIRQTKELSTLKFCVLKRSARNSSYIKCLASSSSRGHRETQACKCRDYTCTVIYKVHTYVPFETRFHVAQSRFAPAR